LQKGLGLKRRQAVGTLLNSKMNGKKSIVSKNEKPQKKARLKGRCWGGGGMTRWNRKKMPGKQVKNATHLDEQNGKKKKLRAEEIQGPDTKKN